MYSNLSIQINSESSSDGTHVFLKYYDTCDKMKFDYQFSFLKIDVTYFSNIIIFERDISLYNEGEKEKFEDKKYLYFMSLILSFKT